MLPPLPPSPRVVGHFLDLIGDTPLVEIRRLGRDAPRARVLVKCEQLNPGGSVKDRIALAMVEDAERRGQLRPGGTVIEPTSGNTGIGLALVCAAKGYRCILTMPASMSLERRQLLEAYGAKVVLTEPEAQMEGAIAKANELAGTIEGAFLPQQFDNRANPDVHASATARELFYALGNQSIDAFVAAVGTGGTVSGVGSVLKAECPSARVIAVEPSSSATLSKGERGPSKIQGIAAGFVPRNYRPEVVDEIRTVSDREAYDTKRALAREEGLLVGISAGANVFVALQIARELGVDKTVITVLCDTGERYFSLDDHFA
jgi:cysteine synthase